MNETMLITPFGDDSIQVSFDQFKRFYAHKKAPAPSLNLFKLLDGAGQTSTATRMAEDRTARGVQMTLSALNEPLKAEYVKTRLAVVA